MDKIFIMKNYISYAVTALVVVGTIIGYNRYANTNTQTADTNMENNIKGYTAVLHTTAGDITIEFNKDQTPKTVKNFVDLAKGNKYNNTIFHRAIKGFMIQGGDVENLNGMGGPGYKFADEPFTGEYLRGTVAMANSGPNTNGSQFFIMHADYPLPKNYVIFGKVTSGLAGKSGESDFG